MFCKLPQLFYRRGLLAVLVRGIIASLVVGLLCVRFQDYIILPSLRFSWQAPDSISALPEGVEVLTLKTADGVAVTGWRVLATNKKPKRALFFFHGNAAVLSSTYVVLRWLAMQDFAVYSMDYRGTGFSSGYPSEGTLSLDALALWSAAAGYEDFDNSTAVIIGQSFGTGIAAYLASKKASSQLMLISPYTSLKDVAASNLFYRPLQPFMNWDFSIQNYAQDFQGQCVSIIHGERDSVIPFSMGESVSKLFRTDKKVHFIRDPLAGHNDVLQNQQRAVIKELKGCEK